MLGCKRACDLLDTTPYASGSRHPVCGPRWFPPSLHSPVSLLCRVLLPPTVTDSCWPPQSLSLSEGAAPHVWCRTLCMIIMIGLSQNLPHFQFFTFKNIWVACWRSPFLFLSQHVTLIHSRAQSCEVFWWVNIPMFLIVYWLYNYNVLREARKTWAM